MITVERAPDTSTPGVRGLVADAGLPLDGFGEVPTDVFLATADGELVGVAALERHGGHGLLRSVAVAAEHRGRGIGSRLVEAAEGRATELGLDGVYLLTETAAPFFAGRGYEVIPRDAGPIAVMASVEWSGACGVDAIPMVLRQKDSPNRST